MVSGRKFPAAVACTPTNIMADRHSSASARLGLTCIIEPAVKIPLTEPCLIFQFKKNTRDRNKRVKRARAGSHRLGTRTHKVTDAQGHSRTGRHGPQQITTGRADVSPASQLQNNSSAIFQWGFVNDVISKSVGIISPVVEPFSARARTAKDKRQKTKVQSKAKAKQKKS